MSFVGNPEQFKAHIASLGEPDWTKDLEDQPDWVVPTERAQGRPPVTADQTYFTRAGVMDADEAPVRKVPVDQIRTVQRHINLHAVSHYVHNGPNTSELYDPDGWYGTNHPVVVEHPEHGYVLADGNSRFTASLIRGDRALTAHVVSRPDS